MSVITAVPDAQTRSARHQTLARILRDRRLPVLLTTALLLIFYGIGANRYQYENFLQAQVIYQLFVDNGYLLVAAIGATFVILTGGIDLSIGSVIGFTSMLTAALVTKAHLPLPLVALIALAAGSLGGFLMGYVIHTFQIQPFIVTLAGLFLFRGLCLVIDKESIAINDHLTSTLAGVQVPLPGGWVSLAGVVSVGVLAVAVYVLHYTRFGRRVYALGGSEQSALLMGVPVARTKMAVYTVSGFCSALAGLLFVLYTQSGAPLNAVGLELDAIAAVVIGGTLLTGGTGYVIGTLLGVLMQGLTKTLISYEGTFSSWVARIAIGVLLLLFILLQRVLSVLQRVVRR